MTSSSLDKIELILKQAADRQRLVKAVDPSIEHFFVFVEDNLITLRELAAVDGSDFSVFAAKYIEKVVQYWTTKIDKTGDTEEELRRTLQQILETL